MAMQNFLVSRTVRLTSLAAWLIVALVLTPPGFAQDAVDTGAAAAAESEGALPPGWRPGPFVAELGDQIAQVEVPSGYNFLDAETTRTLMEAMGNPSDGSEVGLIAPNDENKNWFIVFEHQPVGYVEDSDQDEIDAAALLENISKATEAANEYRRENGGGELHVVGWQIAPHYDSASHNLQWALEAADESDNRITNYNVRLLGRKGYMSVTLVTGAGQLEADRPEVESVLAGFTYVDGNRYGDFKEGDKLAGYGLTALVAGGAGVAAAKLGLFAVLGKFLGKAWKVLLLGIAALGAMVKRMVGGKRADPSSEQIG